LDLQNAMIKDVEMRGLADAIGPRRIRRDPSIDPVKGITDELASLSKNAVEFRRQLPAMLQKAFTGNVKTTTTQSGRNLVQNFQNQGGSGQPRPIANTFSASGPVGSYPGGAGFSSAGNPIASAAGAQRMLATTRGRAATVNGPALTVGPPGAGSSGTPGSGGGSGRGRGRSVSTRATTKSLAPLYRSMAQYLRDHPKQAAKPVADDAASQ
jgi:hypothetical protein